MYNPQPHQPVFCPGLVLFNKPPGVVTSLRSSERRGSSDLHLKALQECLARLMLEEWWNGWWNGCWIEEMWWCYRTWSRKRDHYGSPKILELLEIGDVVSKKKPLTLNKLNDPKLTISGSGHPGCVAWAFPWGFEWGASLATHRWLHMVGLGQKNSAHFWLEILGAK